MANVVIGLGGFGRTDVALAGTCDIGAAPTTRVRITAGTGPITSFGAGTNRRRKCRAGVAFTLTHGASLDLPTSANIAVEVGDTWDADSDASGNWLVTNYQRKSGLPLSPESTWASLVASTDFYKVAGLWRPLGHGAGGAAHTGTVTETILGTVVVPAGCLGPKGKLRVRSLWTLVTSGNNKTLRHRFGATGSGITGTQVYANVYTTIISAENVSMIYNINSVSVQKFKVTNVPTDGGQSTVAGSSAAINTAAASEVCITAQLANAGDIVTLDAFDVDAKYGA